MSDKLVMTDDTRRFKVPGGFVYVQAQRAETHQGWDVKKGASVTFFTPVLRVTPVPPLPAEVLRNHPEYGFVSLRGKDYRFSYYFSRADDRWNFARNPDGTNWTRMQDLVRAASGGVKETLRGWAEDAAGRYAEAVPDWQKLSTRLWYLGEVESVQGECAAARRVLEQAEELVARKVAEMEKWERDNA